MSTPVVLAGAVAVLALVRLLLQKYSPVYAAVLSIAAGAFLLLQLIPSVQTVLRGILSLEGHTGTDAFSCLLRCTGILLVTDYAGTLCRETGADSLGWCADLAGRLFVLAAAFPMLEEVCRKIWGLAG